MDRQAVKERFGIIGDSPALNRVLDQIRQVAPSDITVLVEGESGVGKELVAQALHGLSSRRHRSLVVVNCGAIPEGLIESELFGHEKGAYTGATDKRTGHFEEADHGTIFLDEIGEMPQSAQVKLLRVLESGQFSRVGSSRVQQVDVRIVAATNKDLGREVRAGRFREDLYYRLGTVILRLPPLRERRVDIVPIFESLLYRFSQEYNAPMKRLSDSGKSLLEQYSWPGNVRELKNVAEQSVVLVRGDTVDSRHLEGFLRGVTASSGGDTGLVLAGQPVPGSERELLFRALFEMRMEIRELKETILSWGEHRGPAHVGTGERYRETAPYSVAGNGGLGGSYNAPPLLPAPVENPRWSEAPTFQAEDLATFEEDEDEVAVEETSNSFFGDTSELPSLQAVELSLIREGLKRFDGNRRQTASVLGISERTLYRKIKELEAYESAFGDGDG